VEGTMRGTFARARWLEVASKVQPRSAIQKKRSERITRIERIDSVAGATAVRLSSESIR
jgi:hypothetical protein